MNQTEKRRSFIIRFVYIALWAALIFCALKFALPLVMPFVIAFGIAFLLKPVIKLAETKTRMSRRVAAVVVLIVFYLVVGGLLTFVGIKLGLAISGWVQNLPAYYATTIEPAITSIGVLIEGFFEQLDPAIADVMGSIGSSIMSALSGWVAGVSGGAVGMATSVGWFFVGAFLAIIASFFFVVDYYKVTSFIAKQLSESARRRLFVIKDYVVNTLFRFARAYLILMTLTFVEVSIGLLILRAPSPFLLALITALVDILPVFGTGTVLVPWAVYSLVTGNYFLGIGLVVLYAAITIIRQVLEPKVVGAQIGLYPLLTLICMFLGVQLFGFWGLFALPITLTVIIHLNRAGEIALFKE